MAKAESCAPIRAIAGDRVELSILSPVYLGEHCVEPLVEGLRENAARVTEDFEIVLIEDGSPDGSWAAIEAQCARDPRVKGVRLSRNFGQNYALTAGLETVRGDHVIVLDCDLQDDPRYIPDLCKLADEGYDIVYTVKHRRCHSGFRNLFGGLFHFLLSWLSGSQAGRSTSEIGNYSILSRRVVDAFIRMKDYHRHYLGLLRWLGFRSTVMEIEHQERAVGETSYTFRKLVHEAINGITSQTDRLLYISIGLGFAFVAAAFLSIGYLVITHLVSGFGVEGWTSVMVLILLCTGIILVSLGVSGIYIGKIFEQAKGRPLYLVSQSVNVDR